VASIGSQLTGAASLALIVALIVGSSTSTVAGGSPNEASMPDEGTITGVAPGVNFTGTSSAPNTTTTETEPNNDLENATRLTAGETVVGRATSDNVDWYALNATSGEVVRSRLELRGEGGDGKPLVLLELYDPNGELIGEQPRDGMGGPVHLASLNGNERADSVAEIADVAPESGTYYFLIDVVLDEGEPDLANYTLTVNATAQADSFEPNDRLESAVRTQPTARRTVV
jgi:hypothetical protein